MSCKSSLCFWAFLLLGSTDSVHSVGVTDQEGAPLGFPEVCSNLNCVMEYGAHKFMGPDGLSFVTRNIKGHLPAATIRARAGDTLRITLTNLLSDKHNTDGEIGTYHLPNTTNVHTHGLHIDGESPADDVSLAIDPGSSFAYEYPLPINHMGGSYWYHSHHDGSTALQAGGGTAGFIIIEDEPGSLPEEILRMPDLPLVIMGVDMHQLNLIQELFDQHMWQVTGQDPSIALLVNGQTNPTLDVDHGRWYRFRMLFTSIDSTVVLRAVSENGDAQCEMQLIATDGVYLHEAPRRVNELPFFPASRADVLVRCTGSGSVNFVADEENESDERRKLQKEEVDSLKSNLRGANGSVDEEASKIKDASSPSSSKQSGRKLLQAFNINAPMMSINIKGDSNYLEADIKPFKVNRPCYVMDTRELVPDQFYKLDFFLRTINNEKFVGQQHYINADQPFLTGQLIELELTGMDLHVFHMHVNHFQLIEVNHAAHPEYYQVGDWHDTIHESGADTIKVRFFVDRFIGPAVIHCHILSHEDAGMMNGFLLAGEFGKEYPNAHGIDPTCFSGSGGRGFVYLDDGSDPLVAEPPVAPPIPIDEGEEDDDGTPDYGTGEGNQRR